MKNANKIIEIKGGLGNQLFQYAHGLKLILIDKKDVVFDTSFFSENNNDIERHFLLKKFNIDPTVKFQNVKQDSIQKLFKKIKQKITGEYGYYQGEKYFTGIKGGLLQQFTLKDPLSLTAQEFADKMTDNSVSIHIRRGDYADDASTNDYHGMCGLDYYYNALECITSKVTDPHFFVFSDDIEWAKNNLNMHNTIFVSNDDLSEYEELILMSRCSHNIIANSTFSWWAAYINQNNSKIIIAPKQWTKKHTSDTLEILPKDWIQL